jgi:hypothetical protein
MTRMLLSKTLPIVLWASAAGWAAHAFGPHAVASSVPTGGAYTVTFHVLAPTTVPDGATLTCKARIAPRVSGTDLLNPAAVVAESIQGVATVSGSAADCTVQVPFAFAVDKANDVALLSYEIDALTAAGPVFVRTQQGIGVQIPPPGTTANVLLDVSL